MLSVRWKSAWARAFFGPLAVTVILVCLVSSAFGQVTTTNNSNDSYYTAYFGNAHTAGVPDTDLVLVNPGSLAGYSITDGQSGPYGDLCANIYVYVSDQQLAECCSCQISPNGMLLFSVNNDLTSNPVTGVTPNAGQIKIVSSYGANGCTTSYGGKTYDVAATTYSPTGSLRAWKTQARPTVSGSLYTVTEIDFHVGTLPDNQDHGFPSFAGSSELMKLQQQCYVAENQGSGRGRCTCGTTPQ